MNRAIRRVGIGCHGPRARCSSGSSPTSRSSTPTSSPTTRATCAPAPRLLPAARRHPHRRRHRSSPGRSDDDGDELRSSSASTRRARPVRPDRRLPVVRVRQHRGRADVQRRARRSRPRARRSRNIGDVLAGKENTGNVVLSISQPRLQAARSRRCSAASRARSSCSNPKTGAILAMYSNPSLRPATRSRATTPTPCRTTASCCSTTPTSPTCPARTASATHPARRSRSSPRPSALDDRRGHARHELPGGHRSSTCRRPTTRSGTSAAQSCGGTLVESFRQSCNTTFGQIGLDLGDEFVPGMEAFGIGSAPPLDLAPGAAASGGPAGGLVPAEPAAVRVRRHRAGRRVRDAARSWR